MVGDSWIQEQPPSEQPIDKPFIFLRRISVDRSMHIIGGTPSHRPSGKHLSRTDRSIQVCHADRLCYCGAAICTYPGRRERRGRSQVDYRFRRGPGMVRNGQGMSWPFCRVGCFGVDPTIDFGVSSCRRPKSTFFWLFHWCILMFMLR